MRDYQRETIEFIRSRMDYYSIVINESLQMGKTRTNTAMTEFRTVRLSDEPTVTSSNYDYVSEIVNPVSSMREPLSKYAYVERRIPYYFTPVQTAIIKRFPLRLSKHSKQRRNKK